MQQSILRLVSVLFLCVPGSSVFAQVYEASFEIKETKKEKVVRIFMNSAQDTAVRIRAVNFSVAFDSTCCKVKDYDCVLSDKWTTFIERSGPTPVRDSLSYEGNTYNARWIFGTGQMPNTENMMLPAKSEKPVRILTVTFQKSCKQAPLYLEDEKEFRVNQMGDANNNAVPWIMLRESNK